MPERHLFLITIGDYLHHPSVQGAAADAKHLEDVLADYGYGTVSTLALRDAAATNRAIRDAFRDLRHLPPEDDLVIYFNGHGHTDEDEVGAWLPYDAGEDLEAGTNLIQNIRIRTYLRQVRCRHVLLLANCCFAGDLLDERRDIVQRPSDFLDHARRFDSREVLTAGASEPVPVAGMGRESPFGWHLCRTLETADQDWIDAMDLFAHIKRGVSGQTPQFGALKSCGHKGGALILERARRSRKVPSSKNSRPSAVQSPPPPPPPPEVQWHVLVDERPSAGMSLAALKREIAAGRVTRGTLVWTAELAVWTSAMQVPVLADAFPAVAVPPPPPESGRPRVPAVALRAKAGPEVGEPLSGRQGPHKTSEPEPGVEQAINLPDNVPLTFCWCPATTDDAWKAISGGEDVFWMGSPDSELGRNDDETLHKVKLTKGFWMGKYPVTQAQWQAVAGDNPSEFKQNGPDAPVEKVSWEDVDKWIQRANLSLGDIPLQLPTEAEWEYACRAGTGSALNNGQNLVSEKANCSNLDDLAWYVSNSGNTTHPVGQKQPNAWGLHDMHGNVLEWCLDLKGEFSGSRVTDPKGPDSGRSRVLKSGNFKSEAWNCRSGARNFCAPYYGYGFDGFRVILKSMDLSPREAAQSDENAHLQPPIASSDVNAFMQTTRTGNIEACRQLLSRFPALASHVDHRQHTPLHYAAEKGHDAIVSLLIDSGADTEARTQGGWTPLINAAGFGYAEVVKQLLDKGAVANAAEARGWNALHWAACKGHQDVVAALLEQRETIRVKENTEDPPHLCRYLGQNTDLLLGAKDRDGKTPIDVAEAFGHSDLASQMRLIPRRNLPYVDGLAGVEELIAAVKEGNVKAVRDCLQRGAPANGSDPEGERPVDYVTSVEVADVLLEHGMRVDCKYGFLNRTPVHDCLGSDPPELELAALYVDHQPVVVNIQDDTGATPLHYAAGWENRDTDGLIQRMLAAGANPNIPDKEGRTVLHWCQEVDAISLLVKAGADLNAKDRSGRTPAHSKFDDNELTPIVVALVEAGADLDVPDAAGKTLRHKLQAFIEEREDDLYEWEEELVKRLGPYLSETQEARQRNYLHVNQGKKSTPSENASQAFFVAINQSREEEACSMLSQRPELAQAINLEGHTGLGISSNRSLTRLTAALVKAGAETEVKSKSGWTPLINASAKGDASTVKVLLDGGANVNAAEARGWTPLHWACCKGHENVAGLLLEQGADRNARDRQGKTPEDVAAAFKQTKLLARFL